MVDRGEHNQRATTSLSAADRRHLVGQAVGVVMAEYRLDSDEAFDTIALAAIDRHRKVYDLAGEIVRAGQLGTP